MLNRVLALLAAGAAFCAALPVLAEEAFDDLAQLSIEELGNIAVTSVSKRAEPLSAAAASIFVITNDDIRRFGATSLPEALRLAPNLQVAQLDALAYAISAVQLDRSRQ
jgi:iron complex outermembrane receptor protein